MVEVVAAAVAEVGRAVERFRGGGRSANRHFLHLLFESCSDVYRVSRYLADLDSTHVPPILANSFAIMPKFICIKFYKNFKPFQRRSER